MKVDDTMLAAAMKTAVASGLVPGSLDAEAYLKTSARMRDVLQAGLDSNANLTTITELKAEPGCGSVVSPD